MSGVMVTDRGKSYDAEGFLDVKQQKCLDHFKENINEVLDHKTGQARSFGLKLKSILYSGATNGPERPGTSRPRRHGLRANSRPTCVLVF
jgi:hypothetical protein